MGHVRQGARGRRDRVYRADRRCGLAGRKRQDGWIIDGELGIAKVGGERRAYGEVGSERGKR